MGHSDADVMLHALMDALLGAAGLGDIGQHFPDTDPAYRGADSARLLEVGHGQRARPGLGGGQRRRLPHRRAPEARPPPGRHAPAASPPSWASPAADLNVKATTTEKLGFTGRGEGLAAQAVVLLD